MPNLNVYSPKFNIKVLQNSKQMLTTDDNK